MPLLTSQAPSCLDGVFSSHFPLSCLAQYIWGHVLIKYSLQEDFLKISSSTDAGGGVCTASAVLVAIKTDYTHGQIFDLGCRKQSALK